MRENLWKSNGGLKTDEGWKMNISGPSSQVLFTHTREKRASWKTRLGVSRLLSRVLDGSEVSDSV
jgi:hypothetical protein